MEFDELSGPRIFPFFQPDILAVTNLFRDTFSRSATPDFVFDVMNTGIPSGTHLILNADDMISCRLAPQCEHSTYFSVAHILEHMGLDQVGTHGTTAALALLNDAVKKGGMMACSRVGGLSGSFIPVSEDKGMIDAVKSGSISMDKLEAAGGRPYLVELANNTLSLTNWNSHSEIVRSRCRLARLPTTSFFSIYFIVDFPGMEHFRPLKLPFA